MDKGNYQMSSFSVILIFLCLGIIGIALAPLLSLQLYPSMASSTLNVSYSWPDVSARVMEQEVTAKLEGIFAGVKGLKNISSVSSKGYGKINLTLKKDVNLDAMRFEIANLIRQCYPELPVDVSYPFLSMNISGEKHSPLITFAVNSNADAYHIGSYIEKEITPQLTRIKGVSEVQLYGLTPYEVELRFQLDQIQALSMTGDDIAKAINDHFTSNLIGKGSYQYPGQDYIENLSLTLVFSSSDSLTWDKIPVKKIDNRIVYLKDIAKARYTEQTPTSYYRVNGRNTINIVIYPEKGVNNIRLAELIREKIQNVKQSLPPGYAILLTSDSTEYLKTEIGKLTWRTSLSLIILLIFVFIATARFRFILIIVIAVVANLTISCIFFYFFKVQLHVYSLAGLTISMGIIINNSIVLIDHIKNSSDRKVILAIFGSTLTTIAALGIIFLFPEQQRLNLREFAWVIIISLSVSFAVTLTLVPALAMKLKLDQRERKPYAKRRRIVKFNFLYGKVIVSGRKYKWLFLVIVILGFGIPFHLLPDKLLGHDRWSQIYNKTIGSVWFKNDIKPTLEKTFGGSLRLFTSQVFENSYYPEPGKTTLYVNGSMPEGCTVQQMNDAVEEIEQFISQFSEVETFHTSISSYRNSTIAINFKPDYEWSGFPLLLKADLESKAIDLGGANWHVYGIGRGFSNAVYDGNKSNRIVLDGYNYEQLYQFAEIFRKNLLHNPRIREVDISGPDMWNEMVLHEFFVAFNNEQMALNDVSETNFFATLRDKSYRTEIKPVFTDQEMRRVFLTSDTYESFNVWDFSHTPLKTNDKVLKMNMFGSIEKKKSGNDIHKYDQQYRLMVTYDFIGPSILGQSVEKQYIASFKDTLPLGYSIKSDQNSGFTVQPDEPQAWDREDKFQYSFILYVVVAIYFICAILLESLRQPLVIIAMIPISFIGVFLAFYVFDLNFDQGGFASLMLLSGLVVNSGLYVVNDFNNYKIRSRRKKLTLYLKAFDHKITPVIFTILSIVLSLIPFIVEGKEEIFWFAFAAGTISGLIFSLIAFAFFLPLFLKTSN